MFTPIEQSRSLHWRFDTGIGKSTPALHDRFRHSGVGSNTTEPTPVLQESVPVLRADPSTTESTPVVHSDHYTTGLVPVHQSRFLWCRVDFGATELIPVLQSRPGDTESIPAQWSRPHYYTRLRYYRVLADATTSNRSITEPTLVLQNRCRYYRVDSGVTVSVLAL